MRWDRLFDDLEAQLVAQEILERDSEVADRTRRERALVALQERLLAHVGHRIVLVCGAGEVVEGALQEVGSDWALVEAPPGVVLAHLPAFRSVTGLGARAQSATAVARAFGVGMALRAICRDRAAVTLVDVTGACVTGTVDAVGRDFVELAEHPLDVPRRSENVSGVRVIPLTAVAVLRRG